MKKSSLKKSVGHRVVLEPAALEFGAPQKPPYDVWTIEEVSDNGVRIRNSGTNHNVLLGLDSVHHYRSDPNKNWDGHIHGVLELHVQLTLSGRKVLIKEKLRG